MRDLLPAISAVAVDRFDLWTGIARASESRRVAEIGVWRGDFAAHLLRGLPDLESYLLVDPWRPLADWNKPANVDVARFEAVRRDAVAATAFAGGKVTLLRGTTKEVVDRIPDGSLDLVYIDGDHTLRGITIDLLLMLRKVRPGGLLGGDDYFADPWHHGPKYEPTLVCPYARYFAEALSLPFVALPFRQFVIVNEATGFSATNLSGTECRDYVGRPSPAKAGGAGALCSRLLARFRRPKHRVFLA